MRLHGSCATLGDDAVLLLGPSGIGKSDLLLRLIDRGFVLVGDDQLELEAGRIKGVSPLIGMIELRGIGLFRADHRDSARLRLVVRLGAAKDRLPAPGNDAEFGVPLIALDPCAASATVRIHWALDAACGRRMQHCGAFAA
ncbi:HPr kinase/phosphorylase [Acidiphilium iwatense]|uniref:Aldolase n=1 Tax=Acidiphilium iwatense TaxID=768198 RepID=A0ABS9DTG3_9PROT|nr:aldolase [Acidiphilium iwatense]MCF3946018.1 aldolase [Acidiphilium iwatense]